MSTASRAPSIQTNVDPHAVTISGLVLSPSYGPEGQAAPGITYTLPDSLQPASISAELPPPGTFPYTRGLFPNGYRSRLWTMRQFAGFGSADDTNKRFKYLLAAAKTGHLGPTMFRSTDLGRTWKGGAATARLCQAGR